jgi:hypothetical protein
MACIIPRVIAEVSAPSHFKSDFPASWGEATRQRRSILMLRRVSTCNAATKPAQDRSRRSFPYGNIPRGRERVGAVNVHGLLDSIRRTRFWMDRCTEANITLCRTKQTIQQVLLRRSHDGLGIELVANDDDQRPA